MCWEQKFKRNMVTILSFSILPKVISIFFWIKTLESNSLNKVIVMLNKGESVLKVRYRQFIF